MVQKRQVDSENAGRFADIKFDVHKIRKDFPVLHQKVHGKPLIYLDSAATSQKPRAVIDAVSKFYAQDNSNIHRGVFSLSERATMFYEGARRKIQTFMNAASPKEIIFVRGATEAINLVAQSYGRTFLKAGDEILITHMEHHANIVPWQLLSEQTGVRLRVAPINDAGELIFEEFEAMLCDRTKFVSVCHVSNVLGTVNPVKRIIRAAHARNIPVLIDGAQAIPHMKVDVLDLDCEFYVFSGHKVYGPTGIGVLYGKESFLEKMPPYQGGGDMISSVAFEKTTYNVLPYRFEAGTPHIDGVIGLGAAIDYIQSIGIERIGAYEHELLEYATRALSNIKGLRMIGTANERASVISFFLGEAHAHDIGTILDRDGIAIRAGHHCAMPLMQRFKVPATSRISLAFYNTKAEIDQVVKSIEYVVKVFR